MVLCNTGCRRDTVEGAKVIRGSGRSVLYNEPLDRDGAVRLVNFCLERGLQVYVINGREWYVNRQSWMIRVRCAAL